MLRCTSSRDPATHVCPVAAKLPETTPFTALSISASSNTMFGDLPPSSMLARFRPEAGDDVDDARRDAGLLDELHELEERRRRELRRLEDHRVAGGKRGR